MATREVAQEKGGARNRRGPDQVGRTGRPVSEAPRLRPLPRRSTGWSPGRSGARRLTGSRTKLDKVDTADGWESVHRLAVEGVPYDVFLHQRHMGGAFRQLLDAASEERGEMLEAAVQHSVRGARRAVCSDRLARPGRDRRAIQPHHEPGARLRPLRAARHASERSSSASSPTTVAPPGTRPPASTASARKCIRLGGVPVFALLDGLGWERINDALAPVVAHCDGRVFTLETLPAMLETQPFPQLVGVSGEIED